MWVIRQNVVHFQFVAQKNAIMVTKSEERKHPQPKRIINEWVESWETEQALRKSSTRFTWDVHPGACCPYIDKV